MEWSLLIKCVFLQLFLVVCMLAVVTLALPINYLQGLQHDISSITAESTSQLDEGTNGHYHEDNYGPAEYEFHYGVQDEHTGDIKSQSEERKGDVVHGRYELIDSDGYHRIVEYTADDHNGFQAIVRREPTDIKIPAPERHLQEVSSHIVPEVPYGPLRTNTAALTQKLYYVSSTASPLRHLADPNEATAYLGETEDALKGLSGNYEH